MLDKWCDMRTSDEAIDFRRNQILTIRIREYDDDDETTGYLIYKMNDVSDYPLVQATFLGASTADQQKYYGYFESEDKEPNDELWLHFCSGNRYDCDTKEPPDASYEFLHVDCYRVTSNRVIRECIEKWNLTPLGDKVYKAASEANRRMGWTSDASKAESPNLATLKAETKRPPLPMTQEDKEKQESKKRKRKGRKLQEVPYEGEGAVRPKAPATESVLEQVLEDLRVMMGDKKKSTSASAAIEDAPEEPSARGQPSVQPRDKPAVKVSSSPRKAAAEVLAQRAKKHTVSITDEEAGLEGGGASSDILKLAKILKRRDGEDSDDELGVLGDAAENKRMQYRRLAKSKPGLLLLRMLKQMREQVSSLTGEDDGEMLSPVCVRFYFAVFLPNHQKLDEIVLREVRTLCEALDGLLRGKTMEVGDLLAMRLKAVMLASQEGGWEVAKHLELLPPSNRHMPISHEEEILIRRVEAGEMKVRELVDKISKNRC